MTPPYAAHLRVYEPLEAFEDDDRGRWEAYLAGGQIPRRQDGPALERAWLLAAVIAGPPDLRRRLPEHAYVEQVDEQPMVCPWNTRLRYLAAVADSRSQLPFPVDDWVVPHAVAMRARRLLRDENGGIEGRRLHIQSHRWGVPVRWYTLFDRSERQLSLGPVRELRYLTSLEEAQERIQGALEVLREMLGPHPTVGGVEDLADWLDEFHPGSRVELDYGGLVYLLDDETIDADNSPDDVSSAIAGLESGESETALASYERATSRWESVRRLESLN